MKWSKLCNRSENLKSRSPVMIIITCRWEMQLKYLLIRVARGNLRNPNLSLKSCLLFKSLTLFFNPFWPECVWKRKKLLLEKKLSVNVSTLSWRRSSWSNSVLEVYPILIIYAIASLSSANKSMSGLPLFSKLLILTWRPVARWLIGEGAILIIIE